jgi:hypothetical protein
VENK